MYSKYGEGQGWQKTILDSNSTELGGFKEVVFELSAKGGKGDVFSKMKYEAGVHRVQRIPLTEKGGRIHTSTASVAVLPKPRTTQSKINLNDLKTYFYNASGPGGQNVNKRKTAVRIVHLPTGMVVTSQASRNQLKNKESAMKILEARLLEKKTEAEQEKIADKRKTQIGWAKRAEKIRTYNFPQDRITDHRIKKSWKQLEKILNGELDVIISALQKYSD
jgi:peptide chain release factor 1